MRRVTVLLGALSALLAMPAEGKMASRKAGASSGKVDEVRLLAQSIALNLYHSPKSAITSCDYKKFQILSEALYFNRNTILREKGEFETTDEFQNRQDNLSKALNGQGDLQVCMSLDDPDTHFSYNADTKTFHANLDDRLVIWRKVRQVGSYVGRTAMGARANVKASSETEYVLEISGGWGQHQAGCLTGGFSSTEVAIPIGDNSPSSLKYLGKFVIIGNLASPFFRENANRDKPTIDDPTDIYSQELIVQFNPTQLMVVNPDGNVAWECRIR